MMRSFKPALALAFALLASCSKEEVSPRNYPRVLTGEVTEITEAGAVFHGQITFTSVPVVDHGFVWSTLSNFEPKDGDALSLGPLSSTGSFTAPCTYALKAGEKFYVRAYAVSENHAVYGDVVTFISRGANAPVMLDFSPKEGTWDDVITITGKNMTSVERNLIIKFGEYQAFVLESSPDKALVKVPFGLDKKECIVSLSLASQTSTMTDKFILRSPQITSIEPAVAAPGEEITINGQNLNGDKLKVVFGTTEAALKSTGQTKLTCLVPADLPAGAITVSVRTGEDLSVEHEFTVE